MQSQRFDAVTEPILHRRSSAAARVLTPDTASVWPDADAVFDRGASLTWQVESAGRRVLNVLVALLALIVVAPLMAVIALLVRFSSPGPVIYKQTRVGVDRRDPYSTAFNGRRKVDYGGRLFTIYKFRTMTVAQDPTLQLWARPDDARVTRIGAVLRKYRLDELPQLVNVLKGDMNIVGPRPEQPKIFMQLREEIELYPSRQRVLPGITGWAQVNLSYDTSIDDVRDKVRYDLEYIHRASLVHDLYILVRTVPVVLLRKGGW